MTVRKEARVETTCPDCGFVERHEGAYAEGILRHYRKGLVYYCPKCRRTNTRIVILGDAAE